MPRSTSKRNFRTSCATRLSSGAKARAGQGWRLAAAALLWLGLGATLGGAAAEPTQGLAMHGAPALPEGFAHLPYADPEAPKGGRMVFGEMGGFDSLNPYILRGRAPWAVRTLTVESLLGRNWDEPFGLYPLLAESVETPPDRSWVEFHLHPEARFSDGAPVTVDDVIWSMETLADKGLPAFRNVWRDVTRVERVGARGVRFHFGAPDREAPLILGLRPILRAAAHQDRDFAESSMTPLIGSGPYVVASADPGRSIVFRRNPDWWGRDLPFNAGRWNLDEIRHDYYRDDSTRFEAFRAGLLDFHRESDPARWAEGYDFPAAARGEILRAEIPHARPSGLTGFVFNTRRPHFADWRVRRALTLAFDFEWVNRTLNRDAYARIDSLFGNSPLGFRGPAEGAEAALLAPFAADLPPGALEGGPDWPATDGSGRNRANLRAAAALLAEAGWTVRDGALRDPDGRPFAFEILLSGPGWEGAANAFARMLEPLGIAARVRGVDGPQYEARRGDYDFDMIVNTWASSLSPGTEQRLYWGREGVDRPGTRNYPGVDSPAAEAAIDALLAAETAEDFTAAARALDRVVTTGLYVIPLWHAPASRIAWRAGLGFPDRLPLYGDWTGWAPDVWWDAR